MAFFEYQGIQFHYRDQGEGLPVVFLHGLGGDISQTQDFLGNLKGIRFISLDFRGHGLSETTISPDLAKMHVFSQDLYALVGYLKLDQFVLGGISLGAAISLRFCLEHPSRVSRLILVRPAWLNQTDPQNFRDLKKIAWLIEKFGTEKGLEEFKKSEDYQKTVHLFPKYAQSLEGQFKRKQAAETYSLLKYLPEDAPFRDWEEIKALTMPTLVLANEADPLHPLTYGEELAHRLPQAIFQKVTSRYLDSELHKQACLKHISLFLGLE